MSTTDDGGKRGKISYVLAPSLSPLFEGVGVDSREGCQLTRENAVVGRNGGTGSPLGQTSVYRPLRRKVGEEEDELLPSSPPVEDPSFVGRNL